MRQGVSYVRRANLYIRNIIPSGGSCPSAVLDDQSGAMLNFAFTEFSEVRASSVLWPVFVPWSTYTALTQEYAALVAWPTEIALKA
jgi:hypothetical protein